jgi:hypothetical protein
VPAAMSAGRDRGGAHSRGQQWHHHLVAAALHRLGRAVHRATNQVTWSGFGCGGYDESAATDGRAFLCNAVAPGAAQDITFNVTVPPGRFGLGAPCRAHGAGWRGNGSGMPTAGRSAVSSSSLPDVVVVFRRSEPAQSHAGPEGQAFSAVVRNLGPVANPSGCPSRRRIFRRWRIPDVGLGERGRSPSRRVG